MLMFLSEWHEFPSVPCLAGKKTWWQLASQCCWNRARPWHASKLVSFLIRLRTYQHPGVSVCVYIYIYLYRVSQEECARLREGVPYVKVYRYNPKHLCPKRNGYGDNGHRKVRSSCGSTHCTCRLAILRLRPWVGVSYDAITADCRHW